MIFSMNAQDLLDGLNTVTRALAARPAKQILEGVLIEAEDSTVVLTCSDGSLSIESTLTAQVTEPGRAVLPGKLFAELVRKLPGGTVNIKVGSNFGASISCMSSKSNLAGMNPAEYPEMAQVNSGVNIRIPQNQLKDMISRVVFAIATDESRQILTGCLLEVDRCEARLVALDGFRLAIQKVYQPFDLPENKELLKAVIPGRVLSELSKILLDEEDRCELLFDKTRMQATFGNTRLSTVLLAGDYIDYRKILPPAFRTQASANRLEMQNAIDRASLMAREGKNNLVRLSFAGNTLSITSNAELGDVHEEMDAIISGDPIDIAFNAKYIADVIRNISDEDLCMKFNTNVSPCVVTPRSGDQYLYLILPVRVFQ
ncbi:MAG: DNA polymerase III subunit beta [Clostridiales bacterium]|nr:DNA polymerase III subunit beta [Clostridiales bacterium]